MIVERIRGDIFKSNAQTLVCPVNTVGTMGAGLAWAFKQRFVGLEKAYKRACQIRVFRREGFLVFTPEDKYLPRVLCLPTKAHWSRPSKLEWIDHGLYLIARDWKEAGLTSLAIPAIGCGHGQLPWPEVEDLIEQHLDPIQLPVTIYLP